MAHRPPPLPATSLHRVERIALLDGGSLLIVAGGFAVLAALSGDLTGTLASGLAAAAGGLELYGVRRLRQADQAGLDWLIRAQGLVFITLLAYATLQWISYDPATIRQLMSPTLIAALEATGGDAEEALALAGQALRLTYVVLVIVTFVYQGGMMLYYRRQKEAIGLALRNRSALK